MKSSEMINNIKTLLNIEVKLEDMKLENGTVVMADSFEKGKEIFIKTDDEKVAMPVGEYLLEDGRLVVVEEEGMIADVREVSDEVPAKEDAKEETSDLKDEESYKEEDGEMAKEDDMMRDMMGRIQNLEDAIADLKADKVDASEDDVELKENIKQELSAPASEPIKHSPETNSGTVNQKVFAKSKVRTTLDRVINKLNK